MLTARPAKKMAVRSTRATVQRCSPGPSTQKAEIAPPQPGPSRAVNPGKKTSIRDGYPVNDNGAMECPHAIELPPLGGTCLHEHTQEDGTIIACNKTFTSGFPQKKSIHNHIEGHVAEMARRLGINKYGASNVKAKCFHSSCGKEQEFRIMVRHIETMHFGVQRWKCKHCPDNQNPKTRMDKTTVERHLKTCRNWRRVSSEVGSEEKGEK